MLDAEMPPNNSAVLNIAHVIKHVKSSATKVELVALYNMLNHVKRGGIHSNYIRRNGTQTTAKANSNQQCHGTEKNKSNGHEIPLDSTMPIIGQSTTPPPITLTCKKNF
jgi:hypothetical protein